MINARVSVRTTGIHGNLWIIGSVEMANGRTVTMTELVYVLRSIDNTLSFILIVLVLMLFFKKMG